MISVLFPPKQRIIMWTIGTNLEDEVNLVKDRWKIFNSRIFNYAVKPVKSKNLRYGKSAWKPFERSFLFKVLESGKEGKKLHYHILSSGFIPHDAMLEAWRRTWDFNMNVNYSDIRWSRRMKRYYKIGKKKGEDPFTSARAAISYVTKYVTKDSRSYAFLGKFRGGPYRPYTSMCDICLSSWQQLKDYSY